MNVNSKTKKYCKKNVIIQTPGLNPYDVNQIAC